MGRAARLKHERPKPIIRLTEAEARRLLAAQRNFVQAQLAARQAVELVNAKVRSAGQAQAAVFDALAAKYHLDPAKKYTLDDERLTLTPQQASR